MAGVLDVVHQKPVLREVPRSGDGEMRRVQKLILVFDADSGRLAALLESLRKVFGVGGCALCRITHGLAGERREWKRRRAELGLPVDYLHRDQLRGRLQAAAAGRLPCVLAETVSGPMILLAPEVLERCRNLDDFQAGLLASAARNELKLPESQGRVERGPTAAGT